MGNRLVSVDDTTFELPTAVLSRLDARFAGITDPRFFAADNIVYVSGNSGNDLNTGLAPGEPFKTLTKAVATLTTGGRIVVLPGNVQLTAPVVITQSNLVIEGSGLNNTAIIVNGNYDAFTINGAIGQVTIKNMWIGSFAARTAGNGITVTGTSGAHSGYMFFENLIIQNTYGGIQAQYADSITYTNIRYAQSIAGAQGAPSVFGVISGACHYYHNVQVAATTGTMAGDGFRLDSDTDTIALSKCLVLFAKNGILLQNSLGGAASGPRLVRVTDSYFESCSAAGVAITASRDVRLAGVHSAVNTNSGYLITGGTSIKLTNCVALQNGLYGYLISGATVNDCHLIGCDASNNSTTTSGSVDGCNIGASTSHVRIIGCRFGDFIFAGPTQRYGLTVSGTSTDYIVAQGNDFAGNVTGGLNNASVGTHNSLTGNVT